MPGSKNLQEACKKAVAQAALQYIKPDMVIGVGTGSTIHYFIEQLASIKTSIKGAVSSSTDSSVLLKKYGIPLFALNEIETLVLYVDGADEVNPLKQSIKGRGGALTQEKILASAAEHFLCIVDYSKSHQALGHCPIPVEVIPMARSYVARQMVALGGRPVFRESFETDNGNVILDVHDLDIQHPMALEKKLNQIPGVVCHGLFAVRAADRVLIGFEAGVEVLS